MHGTPSAVIGCGGGSDDEDDELARLEAEAEAAELELSLASSMSDMEKSEPRYTWTEPVGTLLSDSASIPPSLRATWSPAAASPGG
jgi:hypothetical protein